MNTNNLQKGRLYKTDEYSIFDTHEYNRPYHEDPILVNSLREKGFMPSSPIHCKENGNGKLKIVRGHHRFHFAKMLKIPVYYIIDNTEVDIYYLEGSSKPRWSAYDFLFSRARSGDNECKALLSYQKTHRLPLGAAAELFAGRTSGAMNALKEIKKGTFHRGEQEHGEKVISILDSLDSFNLDFARCSSFVKAISHVVRIPDLKVDELLRKTQSYGSYIHKRATYQDYLEEIENLYNRGKQAKDRLPIKILANAVAQKRKETFGRKDK
jgi:hypothetical protein